MRWWLVAACLIALSLSGCVGGVGTMTARDGLEAAADAATALAGSPAALVGVTSLEPFREYIDEEGDGEIRIHLDDRPGDGKAPGWVYLFTADDSLVTIGYASGLGVVFEVREGGEARGRDEAAIEGWTVDSDAAARALQEHPDWPRPTDASALWWELTQEDACPVWTVQQSNGSEVVFGDAVEGRVDACTGEVLSIEQRSGSFSCGEAFGWSSSTFLPIISSGDVLTMHMDDAGTIQYAVEYGAGIGDVTYRLAGPQGTVAEGTSDAADVLEEMPAGEYTLSLSGDVALRSMYVELSASSCSD